MFSGGYLLCTILFSVRESWLSGPRTSQNDVMVFLGGCQEEVVRDFHEMKSNVSLSEHPSVSRCTDGSCLFDLHSDVGGFCTPGGAQITVLGPFLYYKCLIQKRSCRLCYARLRWRQSRSLIFIDFIN